MLSRSSAMSNTLRRSSPNSLTPPLRIKRGTAAAVARLVFHSPCCAFGPRSNLQPHAHLCRSPHRDPLAHCSYRRKGCRRRDPANAPRLVKGVAFRPAPLRASSSEADPARHNRPAAPRAGAQSPAPTLNLALSSEPRPTSLQGPRLLSRTEARDRLRTRRNHRGIRASPCTRSGPLR